jgi:peptidoglycan/LPS O-acetylase OafA/YrhL
MARVSRQSDLSPAARRIPELDGVRGGACGLVVLWHVIVGATYDPLLHWPRYLFGPFMVGGVDLFFVLSGFLIGGILMDHRGADNYFRNFWSRRVLRIFPVYFLLLATYLGARTVDHVFHPHALEAWLIKDTVPTWPYFVFLQNYFMSAIGDVGSYWIGVTWSLGVEEQFYFVMPLLIFLLPRKHLVGLALTCVVAAFLLRAVPSIPPIWKYLGTPFRIDDLMLGVLVACLVRNPAAIALCRSWRAAFDAIVLAMLAFYISGWAAQFSLTLSFLLLGLIFAYAILRIFLLDGGWYRAALRMRWLCLLGAISYPLYMYHQAINGLVFGILYDREPGIYNVPQLAAAISVLILAVGAATASTIFFERPFILRGHLIKYQFGQPQSVEAGHVQAVRMPPTNVPATSESGAETAASVVAPVHCAYIDPA